MPAGHPWPWDALNSISVLHDLPLDFLIFPSSLLLFSSQKPATASSLALLSAASPSHLPAFHNVPQGVSQRDKLLKNAPWQKLNWSNAVQFWVSWGRSECILPMEMCSGIGVLFFFNNLAISVQMKNRHTAHLASAISASEIKPLKIRA